MADSFADCRARSATSRRCSDCGCGRHAINYETPTHINLRGDVLKSKPSVCFVCPRCDSGEDPLSPTK